MFILDGKEAIIVIASDFLFQGSEFDSRLYLHNNSLYSIYKSIVTADALV